MIQVARIAALRAMRSVWRPRQASMRSATARPFGMTKVLNFKAATATNRGPVSADTRASINNGATSPGRRDRNLARDIGMAARTTKIVRETSGRPTGGLDHDDSQRARVRPHPPQHAILDDVVMEKRGIGMKQHHRDNDIRYDAMPCIDAAHELLITEPWKVPQVKQRKRVSEHVGDAECHHDKQQQVQQPMRRHCEQMTHAAFGRRQAVTADRTPHHMATSEDRGIQHPDLAPWCATSLMRAIRWSPILDRL